MVGIMSARWVYFVFTGLLVSLLGVKADAGIYCHCNSPGYGIRGSLFCGKTKEFCRALCLPDGTNKIAGQCTPPPKRRIPIDESDPYSQRSEYFIVNRIKHSASKDFPTCGHGASDASCEPLTLKVPPKSTSFTLIARWASYDTPTSPVFGCPETPSKFQRFVYTNATKFPQRGIDYSAIYHADLHNGLLAIQAGGWSTTNPRCIQIQVDFAKQ
jgi:hypothetical protein